MTKLKANNVFSALGFEEEEALNLTLRAHLMMELSSIIDDNGWSLREAASHFGVAHPRISDIKQGRIDRLSLDYLVGLLTKVGKTVTMVVKDVEAS